MDKRQFILNTLLPYFKDPSKRAIDVEQKQCYYRAPNGNKCAIGQHIPDEKYEKGMEMDAITLFEMYPDCLSKEAESMGFHPELWEAIQSVHDDAFKADGSIGDFALSHIDKLEQLTELEFPELRDFIE